MSEEIKTISLSFVEPTNSANEQEESSAPKEENNEPCVCFDTSSSLLVDIKGLAKSYGVINALKGINLQLGSKKIIGLLGPNGSGKTTMIKILAGLLTPSHGSATIDGKEIGVETKAIVSYLPERPYFNSWMRVDECLDFFQDFYDDFDREVAEQMLKDLAIEPKSKLRTLSKGTKEKVQLILVMSRRARLYLLDEPIAGVDPAARDYILDTIIRRYNKDASVIISTHLISDVEGVLDEYIFIRNGDIVEHSSIDDFKAKNADLTLDSYFREVFRYVR